jgi:ubiquitin-protein ligase
MKKRNQKRLLNDVVDIMKNPLEDNYIYYNHDENNMLKGYALIMGPDDTLYRNGYYLFEFNFPKDYPYSPPKLKYLTNNGHTRFHPNLYRTGKVCLSILNTWRGEQWTSCQTIRSVLLTLVTLFHNKPLLNEPGITEKYKDFNKYNEIIEFENYNTAIIGVLQNKCAVIYKKMFEKNIHDNFKKNKDKIKKKLDELIKKNKKKQVNISIYNNMASFIDYQKMKILILDCEKEIK